MGRAATLNGNGNGHAVLPPDVLEPMRRYRQPEPPPRSSRSLFVRVLGWLALAVVVVASGLGGGLYLYAHQTLNEIAPHTKQAIASQKDLHPVASPSAPATALLIGYDQRAGAGGFGKDGSRSDTIMLVRADPTNDTLSMLPFPRDLQVPIYCDPSAPRTTDRINAAWSLCQEKGTLDTVEKLTGVSINYIVAIDFHGFKLLVNKLHGVYMQVDHRYINTQGGPSGYAKIDLEPGYQKLNGQQALDFVRFRHTDNDLYRNARQQLFIEALKTRMAGGVSLLAIPGLIGALKQSIEVIRAGGGSVTLGEIESYAGLAYRLPAGHLFRNSLDRNLLMACGGSAAELCASSDTIAKAVAEFEHPDVTLPKRANASALGLKPKAPKQAKLEPAEISTLVLNGTTLAGFARDTSYKLAQAGYRTVQLPAQVRADAPSQDYTTTWVFYDPLQTGSKTAAAELAPLFGKGVKVAALSAEIAPFAQQAGNPLTVVVVGTAFDGTLATPPPPAAPPERQPPAVSDNPGLTLPYLQENRTKLGFAPLVPHAIASGSNLSSLDGIRVYKPAPHEKAVVMTFVTPAQNVYWQIEETTWTGAPILRNPTGKYRVGGRTFDLYTVGGHIHMIALRHGDAVTWVANTLLDELSNETMLAIAKGLQPLAN